MATRAHELVWAAVLLEVCPNVETIGLRVDSDSFWIGGEHVPVITVDVHARGQSEAERLARALRLGEVEARISESEHYGPCEWRTWQGWAAEGSRQAAVWVSVTGSDYAARSAVA
jgi:hypothetical protein